MNIEEKIRKEFFKPEGEDFYKEKMLSEKDMLRARELIIEKYNLVEYEKQTPQVENERLDELDEIRRFKTRELTIKRHSSADYKKLMWRVERLGHTRDWRKGIDFSNGVAAVVYLQDNNLGIKEFKEIGNGESIEFVCPDFKIMPDGKTLFQEDHKLEWNKPGNLTKLYFVYNALYGCK